MLYALYTTKRFCKTVFLSVGSSLECGIFHKDIHDKKSIQIVNMSAVTYEEVSTIHITCLIPEVFRYYFIDPWKVFIVWVIEMQWRRMERELEETMLNIYMCFWSQLVLLRSESYNGCSPATLLGKQQVLL